MSGLKGAGILFAAVVILSANVARPQSAGHVQTAGDRCASANSPEQTILRCTAVIKRGQAEPAPSLAAAYRNRGEAYFFNGKLDLAIADFTTSLHLSPDAQTYIDRGGAFDGKGDMQHAKEDWMQAKAMRK